MEHLVSEQPPSFPLDQVSQRAIASLLEFRATQSQARTQIARPRARWTMPQREFYKINFDGAVFRAGIGDII